MKLSINNYHKEEYEKRSTYMKLNHLVEGRNLNKLQLLYIVIFTIFLLPACSQDLSRSEAEDLLKNKIEEVMLYGELKLGKTYRLGTDTDREALDRPAAVLFCGFSDNDCDERKVIWSRFNLNSLKEVIETWKAEGWINYEQKGSTRGYSSKSRTSDGKFYPVFHVARTEKLNQYITGDRKIAIAKIIFDKVTGVTMLDNNTAKVTYITKLEPTEAGKYIIKGIDQSKSNPEKSIHLRRYDDGWRIEKEN